MKTIRRALLLLLVVGTPAALLGQGAKPATGPSADFVAPGPLVPLPAPVSAALDGVRGPSLAAHIRFLAAPSLEGRGLGGSGLEAAADYVAAMLALAGIRPLGGGDQAPGAYFQPIPTREITRAGGQLTIDGRSDNGNTVRAFSPGVDCVLPEIAPQTLTGPAVFAGYGIREPALQRDDFRDLDVRGKVVVLLGGLPPGAEWQTPDLLSRYGEKTGRARYAAKIQSATALGARAVLAIEADFAARTAGGAAAPVPYFLLAEDGASTEPPLVVVSPAVARALLASAGLGPAAAEGQKPRALPGVTVTIQVTGDERVMLARNVLGVIPGSDRALQDEAVVIGAHVDHLGRSKGAIYPGADDNASGVAALLEIARAFQSSPRKPKRTVVLAFWTGEEEGHLGSTYYVRHPLWPLAKTAVYANLDMIAHPWLPEEIKKLVAESRLEKGDEFLAAVKAADFIEPGVAEWAPDLCPVLARAGRGLGLALHFDRTDGKNGGSDYRAFARKGTPFIRFFGNYFPGYHEPIDTADTVDVAQVAKMTRLALATTWLLADR